MTSAEAKHAARKRVLHSYAHEVGRVVKVTGEVIKRSAIATVGGTVYQNGPHKTRRGGIAEIIFPHSFAQFRHRYVAEQTPYPLRTSLPISTVDLVRDLTAFGGGVTLLAYNESALLASSATVAVGLATGFGIALIGEVMHRRERKNQPRRR